MSLEMKMSLNSAQFLKKLNKFVTKGKYVAQSKAEQRTVEAAQKKAKLSMPLALDKPAKATINSIRRQFRSAQKIKSKQGSSKVFIAPFLVDEIWVNTVTELSNRKKLETKNPQSGKGLVLPVKRLRNPAGGLRGFRSKRKLDELRKNKVKYFEVTIGRKIRGKLGYLKPGIYEVRQLKRSRKIRLVVAYRERRMVTPKWKFRQIVLDSYSETLPIEMQKAWNEEIKKAFR